MGHPNLNLDTSKLPDLLDDNYYYKALSKHIEVTQGKIATWFHNALEKNYIEWQSNVMPYTIEGNYESSMPNDINTMLIQQVLCSAMDYNYLLTFFSHESLIN